MQYFTLRQHIPLEVLAVGLPGFMMTLMSTASILTLNKIISGYSNEAVASMGSAKTIDLMAYAIAQGMTQGTLPLIGYTYSAGKRTRMRSALKALPVDCLCRDGADVLWRSPCHALLYQQCRNCGIWKSFLRIVCLACPSTALNFLAIIFFQAIGKKLQLLRKGGLDIPLMLLFRYLIGIQGIAWATPLADLLALTVSAALVIPYLKKLWKPIT